MVALTDKLPDFNVLIYAHQQDAPDTIQLDFQHPDSKNENNALSPALFGPLVVIDGFAGAELS